MTRNKKLNKAVRARMAETGERFCDARRVILQRLRWEKARTYAFEAGELVGPLDAFASDDGDTA